MPDFVATRGLAIKFEPTGPELPRNLSIAEPGKPAHLCRHYDGEVSLVRGRWQRELCVPLAARLDELSGDVPCDIQSLGDGSALRYQSRQFVGGCQVESFRQFLDLDTNNELHLKTSVTTGSAPRRPYRTGVRSVWLDSTFT